MTADRRAKHSTAPSGTDAAAVPTPAPAQPPMPVPVPVPESAHELAVKAEAESESQSQSTTAVVDVSSASSALEPDDTPRWSDTERLERSPVPDWFPGITWEVVMTWLSGTCYRSTTNNGDPPIMLIIEDGDHVPAGDVRYTRPGGWEDGSIGWFGPVVTSAADVGQLIAEGV